MPRSDDLVLLRLDRRDDVAHGADAGSLDLLLEDRAATAGFARVGQVLILVCREPPLVDPEPTPEPHPHRAHARGPIEGRRELGPPVDDDRVTLIVVDVSTPDIPTLGSVLGVVEVESTEEERGRGVVGEGLDPAVEGEREDLGGDLVATDRAVAQRFSLDAHPRELGPRVVEVVLFIGQVVAEFSAGGRIGRVIGGHDRTPPGARGKVFLTLTQVPPSNRNRRRPHSPNGDVT